MHRGWPFLLCLSLFSLAACAPRLPSETSTPLAAEQRAALAEVARWQQQATALAQAGRLAEAEALYTRILGQQEQHLGTQHADVIATVTALGQVVRAQGRAAEAQQFDQRLTAALERMLQPTWDVEANSISAEAEKAHSQGQYAVAEARWRQALDLRLGRQGAGHIDVAVSQINLASTLVAQSKYQEAETLYRQALPVQEKTLGAGHLDVAFSLNNLAELQRIAGKYQAAEPLYKRALAIREKGLGPTHAEVAVCLNNLAVLYHQQGQYQAAEPLYRRVLSIAETTLGPEHRQVAVGLNNLATLYQDHGRGSDAEPLYKRALAIMERLLGAEHPDLATSLNSLAAFYAGQQRFAEAETLYRRSAAILMRAYNDPSHPKVAASLTNLARLSSQQGQSETALALHQQAVTTLEQKLGAMHPEVASSLSDLAHLYRTQRQYAAAEPLYRRALAIREQAFSPYHPAVATSFNDLASLALAQQRYEVATELYTRALSIRERLFGVQHPDVASSLYELATVYDAQQRYDLAETLYQRVLLIQEQALGAEHPDLALSLHTLALMQDGRGETATARQLFERARRIYLRLARLNSALDDTTLRAVLRQSRTSMQAYIRLLANLARTDDDTTRESAARDAFVVAEQLRGGTVQAALARAGARAAVPDQASAELVTQTQTLRERLQATRKELNTAYSRIAEPQGKAQLAQLHSAESELDQALQTALERLHTALPQYPELTAPLPITAEAVGQLLQADEALLSLFALEDRLLLWLIRPGQPLLYHEVLTPRALLASQVAHIRASLDQKDNAGLPRLQFRPFDVAGAAELYTMLVEPFRPALAGAQHLFIVPDETFLPVPFGILVTQTQGEAYQSMAQAYTAQQLLGTQQLRGYTQIAWLAREYAITVLPSATSLRTLRHIARPPGIAREPFIGFGDPHLTPGTPTLPEGSAAPRRSRGLIDAVQQLAPLPGTRVELQALATELQANPQAALYLGERATLSELQTLNAAGRLATTQVLAFATHALISGEIAGLSQPALVLTPQSTSEVEDDGLLHLEEILQLKLPHTEWVVLSACNTSAADRSGEGLSGLARAFFFAGARAILVSHWSVEDQATRELMEAVFRRYARDRGIRRAEALRQGMLALLQRGQDPRSYFAHPFAWAPFFLVGEGSN
ncbi:MAG: tetratricopeptide repeat protein [Candidatus Tectimicrobiota bacterium]